MRDGCLQLLQLVQRALCRDALLKLVQSVYVLVVLLHGLHHLLGSRGFKPLPLVGKREAPASNRDRAPCPSGVLALQRVPRLCQPNLFSSRQRKQDQEHVVCKEDELR